MSKGLLEHCQAIDVLSWKRLGYADSPKTFELTWPSDGDSADWLICVATRHSVTLYGQGDFFDEALCYQNVRFDWTACRFGGERPWFVCPGARCGRRVTKLYRLNSPFACRQCHRLAYASQYRPEDEKNMWRAHKIRKRLTGEGGAPDVFPARPIGMHLRTYNRLRRHHDQAEDAAANSLLTFVARTLAASVDG
jgi:hypothetical protein